MNFFELKTINDSYLANKSGIDRKKLIEDNCSVVQWEWINVWAINALS